MRPVRRPRKCQFGALSLKPLRGLIARGYDERTETKPGKKDDADRSKAHCGWILVRLGGLLGDCSHKKEKEAPPGFPCLPGSADPAHAPWVWSSVQELVALRAPRRAFCADGAGFPGGRDCA